MRKMQYRRTGPNRSEVTRRRPVMISAAVLLFVVTTAEPVVWGQPPLVPTPQPRATAPAKPEPPPVPERSRHGKAPRRRSIRKTPWGIIPGRPATVHMPSFGFAWPAAWGHPSRPVVSPTPTLNVVRDPHFTPYVPGRPIAQPMASMSLLTPHYVVRTPPQQLWIGGGRLRTARSQQNQHQRPQKLAR